MIGLLLVPWNTPSVTCTVLTESITIGMGGIAQVKTLPESGLEVAEKATPTVFDDPAKVLAQPPVDVLSLKSDVEVPVIPTTAAPVGAADIVVDPPLVTKPP